MSDGSTCAYKLCLNPTYWYLSYISSLLLRTVLERVESFSTKSNHHSLSALTDDVYTITISPNLMDVDCCSLHNSQSAVESGLYDATVRKW